MNWRGRPLTSHEVVVNSIAATRTRTGLQVHAELDAGNYPIGIAISREQLRSLPITVHEHRGTWNYTIAPSGAARSPVAEGGDRDQARAQVLAMLADPSLTRDERRGTRHALPQARTRASRPGRRGSR